MKAAGNSLSSRDRAYLLHPQTNLRAHQQQGPFVIVRGDGIHVFDEEGKAYIEGMAGLWCTSLGFSEPRLVEAGRRQLATLPYYHSFAHKAHDVEIELAEKLVEYIPADISKVFFANSGSEAVDTAMKLVWYYNNGRGRPEKKKLIARTKGYHGVTIASSSLTGLPPIQRDFDVPIARVLHTDCPHYYRFGKPGESEEAFAARLAGNLESLILAEGPDTVAAFFAEPIMGAGGVIVPPETYFEKIQNILKKYDVLFVCDEVICGFNRTGNKFGFETYGIRPDIITMAKALSSGYAPISAVAITDEIYKILEEQSAKIGTFGHGFTYSGHPLPCAIAVETLKIYEERDTLGHVRSVSSRFQDRLRALLDDPLVGEARGTALIGAIELVADKDTRVPFDPKAAMGAKVAAAAQANGLIVRAIGDTIAVCPPLVIEAGQIDALFDRLADAVKMAGKS